MNERLYDTMMKLGVHPDCVDRDALISMITEHMDAGLSGAQGSMMMLPTFLCAEGMIKAGEDVAVIDAGGTNLRAALIRFSHDGPKVIEIRRSGMPGRSGRINVDEMYDEFVLRILPIMPDNGRLALCFSYPFESLPDGEARIIAMTKEIDIEDAAGSLIVDGMKRAFKRAGYERELHITVLNDTPAVLYSALATGKREAAGFILGTGMNAAYFEKTSNIRKIRPVPQERMAVNMEAAYFSAWPAGKVDAMVDEQSMDRGQALFQKLFAGAYLGKVAAFCVPFLAEDGLVSESTAKQIWDELKIWDMSELIEKSSGPIAEMCCSPEEIHMLREMCEALETRAGKLSAALVAAVISRMEENGAELPVPVAVNGSTLLLNRTILDSFRKELAEALGNENSFELIAQENDTLIGSAAAAFLH